MLGYDSGFYLGDTASLTDNDLIAGVRSISGLEEARNVIARLSSGDLRSAINLLEVSYYATKDKHVTLEVVEKIKNKTKENTCRRMRMKKNKDDSLKEVTFSQFYEENISY